MDKQPANFEITPPFSTGSKETALQIIDGQWDDVFSYLLNHIGDAARADGSSEEGADFRNQLLDQEGGLAAWETFVDQLKQHDEQTLKSLFDHYRLQDFEKVIQEIHKIKAGREDLLAPARAAATRDAIDAAMREPDNQARINAVPEQQPYEERLKAWEDEKRIKEGALQAARDSYHPAAEAEKEGISSKIRRLSKELEDWEKEKPSNSVHAENPKHAMEATVRADVTALIKANPPSVPEKAWEEHQEVTRLAFTGRGGNELLSHQRPAEDEHLITIKPLGRNSMRLSADLAERVQQAKSVSGKAQEVGEDLLDAKLVEQVVGVIGSAGEHLNSQDMWETVKAYHLPPKEVAEALIKQKNPGMMFWLYREKGSQLPPSIAADLLAEMASASPKSVMALLADFVYANIDQAKESDTRDELDKAVHISPLTVSQIDRLMGQMRDYDGYENWAKNLLETKFEVLPLDRKVHMTDTVLDEFGSSFINDDLFGGANRFSQLVSDWKKMPEGERSSDEDFERSATADRIINLALKSLETGEREGENIDVEKVLKALAASKSLITANAGFTFDKRTEDLRRKLTAEKGGYGVKVDYREMAEGLGLVHRAKSGGMFSKKTWQWNLEDIA